MTGVWLDPGPNALNMAAVSLERREAVYSDGSVVPIVSVQNAEGEAVVDLRDAVLAVANPPGGRWHTIRVDLIAPGRLPS